MGAGCCSGPPAVELQAPSETVPVQADGVSVRQDKADCCSDGEKCDDKCVDIAANMLVEREGATSTLAAALEKYARLLQKAACICSDVLENAAANMTCCDKKMAIKYAPATDSCCADKNSKPCSKTSKATVSQAAVDSCCIDKGPKSCSKTAATQVNESASCCSATGADLGCSALTNEVMKRKAAAPPTLADPGIRPIDAAERQGGPSYLSISVEGMTCNDCATKLERTLNEMAGTQDVRVNFIRGRADLNFDEGVIDADGIISQARAATGFAINKLMEGSDESINLLVDRERARSLADLNVEGMVDVTVLDKKTVRVTFDPLLIGARDLVRRIGPLSSGLAPPAADPAVSGGRRRFQRLLMYTVLSTVLTVPVVVLAWGEELVSAWVRAVVSFPLGTIVQLFAVPVFYHPALRSLILYRALELDMLVVVSITAAYAYSIVAFGFRMAGQPLNTAEFFETSTLLITLVMLGRLLASYARIRAVAAVSVRSLQSTTAVIVEAGAEQGVEIDTRLLQHGDTFKVLPHSRIPTDGTVIEGVSEVDESMLTGESVPVTKQVGSEVIAGTINNSGILLVKLARLPGRNTVMDIARLVEEASNSKPRIQDLADRVASYFLPVVTAVAALTFIIWIVIGLRVRRMSAEDSVVNAITYAIAVLAVSCPCALGLAVPMVLVIAGGIAARGGVIIKSAESTERSRKVTDVVFDKTGTITEPHLEVVSEEYLVDDRQDAQAISHMLVSGNTHPVSVAIAKHLDRAEVSKLEALGDLRSIPGAGVEADLGESVVRAGNPQWSGLSSHPTVRHLSEQGLTILLVTRDSTPLVVFGLRTRVRPEAAGVVSQLKERGVRVHMVSGDQPRAVEAIAATVGIDLDNAVGSYKPDQKRDYVAALMNEGRYVLFCGDGTNDAVAVAQANVGAQIADAGSASDVTQSAADVVLLSGLSGIPFLLDISQASYRRIVFNFAWSATYNVLAILLAAGAFVKIRIAPAYAGAGEVVSVLPVIAAAMSMLLLKLKP